MTPEVARVLRFCRVLASQAGSADVCRYPLQPERRRILFENLYAASYEAVMPDVVS